jgi:hypothetical protein
MTSCFAVFFFLFLLVNRVRLGNRVYHPLCRLV